MVSTKDYHCIRFVLYQLINIKHKSPCLNTSQNIVFSGAFGVVHRATEKSTGRTFVAKFINTPYPADKAIVKGEINIMNSLHHQKLLNLHDAFEDKHEIVLVLE